MSKNRTCIVCGKEYEYCVKCGQAKKMPAWKRIYCSEDCKEYARIIDQYRAQHIVATVAKNELSELDIKPVGFFGEILNEILKLSEVSSTTKKRTRKKSS